MHTYVYMYICIYRHLIHLRIKTATRFAKIIIASSGEIKSNIKNTKVFHDTR